MNAAIKPATLVHVRSVTERQVAFGNRLGVDISGKSVGVAKAMIEDAIQREFWGETPEAPTERQIALATQLGSDISETTRRVGSAIIEDIIYNLNKEAIVAQQLAPRSYCNQQA